MLMALYLGFRVWRYIPRKCWIHFHPWLRRNTTKGLRHKHRVSMEHRGGRRLSYKFHLPRPVWYWNVARMHEGLCWTAWSGPVRAGDSASQVMRNPDSQHYLLVNEPAGSSVPVRRIQYRKRFQCIVDHWMRRPFYRYSAVYLRD